MVALPYSTNKLIYNKESSHVESHQDYSAVCLPGGWFRFHCAHTRIRSANNRIYRGHHFFFVPVHSQPPSPQNGLPTVPVILLADSIVPLNATTKVGPPGPCMLPDISQPNTTLSPFTAPVTLRGPNGPE